MAAASLPHPLRLATAPVYTYIRTKFDFFFLSQQIKILLGFFFLPDKTDVGMECCRRRMNLNILSSGGSNPSLSANVTIPNPAGGTKTNLPNIIAAVVFNPNFELPGPEFQFNYLQISGK